MKVLVIGWEVSDFMCPLFSTLRKEYATQVDLFELRPKELMKEEAYVSFDNVLNLSLKMSDYSAGDKLSGLLSWFFISKILKRNGLVNSLRMAILYKKLKPVISSYDIVHICYVSGQLFGFFDAIKTAKKLVLTWWGSDILQNNKDFDYHKQEKLVAIARKVTVHQREMKELFLSKFGREYADKVHEMLVVSDVSFLNKFINAIPAKQDYVKSFKHKHNIDACKRIVVVGHSGHTIDNHLDIIKTVAKYAEQVRDRICLVFPMTYGCDDASYFEAVENACEAAGIQSVIFRAFLSIEELLELRMASEVLLRLSTMDALSLSLCETLCAGNVVITGTWLPYGKLRGNNVYFEEVYEIDNAGKKLVQVLDNYAEFEKRCIDNPASVMAVFENENSVKKLYNIYANA
jgi:hypothetical protein